MKIIFLISMMFWIPSYALATEPLEKSTAAELVNDVIAQVKKEHAFDIRDSSYSLMLGRSYIDESNNYESSSLQIGLLSALDSGNLLRFWIQKVWVTDTYSSKLLARTPFKQTALMERYEFHFDFGYSIMEGRNFTRLGPWIADVDNGIYAIAGVFYSMPNKGNIPKKSNDPDPLPGQNPHNSKLVINLGMLWQIYFSSGFGLYTEAMTNIPTTPNENLKRWNQYTWGVLWSFGGNK